MTYYRVISALPCADGPVKRDDDAAWEAWQRRNRLDDYQVLPAVAASHARLVAGTSRAAVMDADLSSTHGRGWWYE